MVCNKNRLVMEVKSGEARGFGFTIKIKDVEGNYNPMDLSEYNVNFEIKLYPYFSVDPLISKVLTLEQNSYTGQIEDQSGDDKGKFTVEITQDDLEKLVPSQEYYVIITLVNGDTKIIISGEGNTSGIFRFCKS